MFEGKESYLANLGLSMINNFGGEFNVYKDLIHEERTVFYILFDNRGAKRSDLFMEVQRVTINLFTFYIIHNQNMKMLL